MKLQVILDGLVLVAIALTLLALSGCGVSMENDEVIQETRRCEEAGLDAIAYYSSWDTSIIKIQCAPERLSVSYGKVQPDE